jgi:hypothetical protein
MEYREGECHDDGMANVRVRARKQGPGFRRAGHRGGRSSVAEDSLKQRSLRLDDLA